MKKSFLAALMISALIGCSSQQTVEAPLPPAEPAPAISAPSAEHPAAAELARISYFWEIGVPDNSTAEFALGPGGYNDFAEDAVFAVGQSDPKKDWPYVQPGPADSWAGGGEHSFTILFGVTDPPADGECSLDFDLADTHYQSPPEARIEINGQPFAERLPKGASDKSIFGDPPAGREHKFSVKFPANLLKAGQNEIAITTVSGSWMLYDWVGLQMPQAAKSAPVAGILVWGVKGAPALVEKDGALYQPAQVRVANFGKACNLDVRFGDDPPCSLAIAPGVQTVELHAKPVSASVMVPLEIRRGEILVFSKKVRLDPVRKWVIYVLPHSHVDIGYTQVQTKVESDHWRFYEESIAAAKKTAGYPPDARFKWNAEVLWATDSYLKQATPEKRQEFLDAVKSGTIGLDALYGNELTALCRPEELVRLLDFSNRLSGESGLPIESAMISDVPGYTWGIVPVLAQSGVKYMSIGPNGGDRIGYTLSAWADRPFYWVSPCGKYRILCWIPTRGYWRALLQGPKMFDYLAQLEKSQYPYDYVQIRHCLGDNAGPAVDLSDFVKDWNAKYAYPHFVIATTAQMFRDFEKKYGDTIPSVSGDFTPYWEDGAASSALETAMNRESAERLVQAEALWAMLQPGSYPDADFYQAWRNAVLYDEHTWGAHNSISEPDSDFAKSQWVIKRAFAVDADAQSRKLLKASLAGVEDCACRPAAIRVFNTTSWSRTDLVILDKSLELPGDLVKDSDGKAVLSQRLSSGELAFIAADVPALGSKAFVVESGPAAKTDAAAKAEGSVLSNECLKIVLNEETGAIRSLKLCGSEREFVNVSTEMGLNDYFYVAGKDPNNAKRNSAATIRVKDAGPLVASLLIESDAPGCRKLLRELRIVDGLPRVDIINTVDKEKIRDKEGVHFAFPFSVPGGVVRMDIPWAVVRPESDQTPGACKNWFTIQRWTDVSNQDCGATLAIVDAPMMEVGGITAETPWMQTIAPSQTVFSYVMNNYWHTNYRDSQEGPTVFRYSIAPHDGTFRADAAARFGTERSQPLIAVPVAGGNESARGDSLLTVEPAGVVVTSLKPSRDGKGLIVRLFNAGGRPEAVSLKWRAGENRRMLMSDLAERNGAEVFMPLRMSAYETITLLAVKEEASASK
ncbi:MAG TPA: polysaccharide lyase family protein [Candidatus Brocadiia bacterium]|nr:polysaccharide lyase family protein [Candidatus Brocadiia bacterium]